MSGAARNNRAAAYRPRVYRRAVWNPRHQEIIAD
jgi:hypothetical protein